MMTRMLFALSLGFAGLIHVTQVNAQTAPQCAARVQVLEALSDKYGETRRGIGVAGNNTVMELFASDASGSWTITATMPDGRTCVMASGQGFETMAEELPAKGDPA
ncbi:MAG: hypothetical protein ACRC14_14640 [Paracoccaceae bacterium]